MKGAFQNFVQWSVSYNQAIVKSSGTDQTYLASWIDRRKEDKKVSITAILLHHYRRTKLKKSWEAINYQILSS